jgi:DNA-binding NtrC family response regulator
MTKILVVDDDKEFRSYVSEALTRAGYEIQSAASGSEAIEKASEEDFDVVLLDLIMPKMSGSDVIVQLRRVSPRSKIIMITAFASIENAVDAIKRGAADYLTKPFKIDDLLIHIKRVLEEARFELSSENGDLDAILGSLSSPIRRSIVQLLAQRNTMRLMELVRELNIADHTKVLFHLRMLKEAGIVQQEAGKSYSLANQGAKALECMKVLGKYIQE